MIDVLYVAGYWPNERGGSLYWGTCTNGFFGGEIYSIAIEHEIGYKTQAGEKKNNPH